MRSSPRTRTSKQVQPVRRLTPRVGQAHTHIQEPRQRRTRACVPGWEKRRERTRSLARSLRARLKHCGLTRDFTVSFRQLQWHAHGGHTIGRRVWPVTARLDAVRRRAAGGHTRQGRSRPLDLGLGPTRPSGLVSGLASGLASGLGRRWRFGSKVLRP